MLRLLLFALLSLSSLSISAQDRIKRTPISETSIRRTIKMQSDSITRLTSRIAYLEKRLGIVHETSQTDALGTEYEVLNAEQKGDTLYVYMRIISRGETKVNIADQHGNATGNAIVDETKCDICAVCDQQGNAVSDISNSPTYFVVKVKLKEECASPSNLDVLSFAEKRSGTLLTFKEIPIFRAN